MLNSNKKSEMNILKDYSDKIYNFSIEFEYFVDRNHQLEKVVKRIINRSQFMVSLPNFLLKFFNKKRNKLIRLSNIVFESIEKNKTNMLKFQSDFINNLEDFDNISSEGNNELNTQEKELLDEYWKLKKLLENEITISYDLFNELQANFLLIESNNSLLEEIKDKEIEINGQSEDK